MLSLSLSLSVTAHNEKTTLFLRRVKPLVLMALICCFAACDTSENSAIRFGLSTVPVTLDPRYATDAVSARLVDLLTVSLVRFNAQDQVIPYLARWKMLSPQRYQFYLGDDFRAFHDGSRLNAADVVATYRSVLREDLASPHRASLSMINHVSAVDENTVEFQLSSPDLHFPARCTLGILPAQLIEKDHPFNAQPVGSGAMQFKAWPHSGELQLNRVNDGQIFRFLTVKDPTVRALKLARGELDVFQGEIPYELLPWLAERASVRIESEQGSTFSYLGFNLQDPAVADVRVRRAISLAIDRQAIINYVFRDAARVANGLFPPEHWLGITDHTMQFDPERARELLQSVGISSATPLSLTYKTSSNPFRIRLATIIQSQLAPLGIHLQISSLDWGTFYADVKAGRFQMYSLSWVGLKLPEAYRQIFHSESVPPQGANRGRYQDAVLDKMIDDAEQLASMSAQKQAYQAVQRHLLETLPIVPLWYEDVVSVQRDRISTYPIARDGAYTGLQDVTRTQP